MSMGGGDWERVLERWGTWRTMLNPGSTVHWGFPGSSAGKESACNEGDVGSIPEMGRSPGGGNGNPLQYSGLENSKDCLVHGVAKSQTRLSDFHTLTHFLRLGSSVSDSWTFEPQILLLTCTNNFPQI